MGVVLLVLKVIMTSKISPATSTCMEISSTTSTASAAKLAIPITGVTSSVQIWEVSLIQLIIAYMVIITFIMALKLGVILLASTMVIW